MNSQYRTKATFHYEKASEHTQKALEFQLAGDHIKYMHCMRIADGHLKNAQYYAKITAVSVPEDILEEEAVL